MGRTPYGRLGACDGSRHRAALGALRTPHLSVKERLLTGREAAAELLVRVADYSPQHVVT